MPTNVKLSKAQLSKIIQSGRFLGNMIDNLGKKALKGLAVPLAEDILPKLTTKATWSVSAKFERKSSEWGAVRAGKGFTSFIEDIDGIIRIIKSLKMQVY